MSYGRVCLTSNLQAFKEIIEHEKTGLLFEKNDEYSLASVILDIMGNKNLLVDINKNASNLLKTKFDWNTIGKTTSEYYKKKLNENCCNRN